MRRFDTMLKKCAKKKKKKKELPDLLTLGRPPSHEPRRVATCRLLHNKGV